jgi:sarcosine oxidase subunit alpha
MKDQPNRLDTTTPHKFAGCAIDRTRPLQFRLNGRVVHGFVGDTVLSAALASGLDAAGQRYGAEIALSTRHAPGITPAAGSSDPQNALPMERTLATQGADYSTVGHRLELNLLNRLLRRRGRSLQVDLARSETLLRPWLSGTGQPGPDADLVIVGAGVAGLSAAVAGAKRGLKVVIVEATPQLGGKARLFGTLEGEPSPDDMIAGLSAAVRGHESITVLTCAEAYALRPGIVRLHQVEQSDGALQSRILDLRARFIVLATGSLERLPVFPGNRLPGVSGVQEAFELAELYGVWPGKSAGVATSSSPAYRLAMFVSDAGISVDRILDARTQPQSRFIEFAKAYGITMAAGTMVAAAAPAQRNKGLLLTSRLALDGLDRAGTGQTVDRLVVCGGWQPDLTLWHMAGGHSTWNAAATRIEPRHGPAGIVLAGSAAGWVSRSACVASGADAVDVLLGRKRRPFEERLVDTLYETPDAGASIGDAPDETSQPAYLDGGWRYVERPRGVASRWPAWLPFAPRPQGWSLADTPQPLDISDIAAGVQLGAIPAASAGIVAQERVGMVVLEHLGAPAARPVPQHDLPLPPPYLAGRYKDAALWVVEPNEARVLDVGALIYANADVAEPLAAIGVVVRIIDGKAVALVAGKEGQLVSVRESGRDTVIRLVQTIALG